ncbi:MAG: two pore domain potassium channel family protein [Rhodobacteraceae bacterium]|nr:two pore domain potassium channel family protein [Paracoccaceae bacterium]
MVVQIALGTVLMLVSFLISALAFWALEALMSRLRGWLIREPHRPKLTLVLSVTVVWVLGTVSAGVWVWALALRALGIFDTMEASVYFALVAFTTLGFGDVLLPQDWRLLGGMAATNGLLSMGLMTAMLLEVLRHVRIGQLEMNRRETDT